MPCYHPLQAYRIDGVSNLSFRDQDRHIGMPVKVPCGQCIGCRLERSRQWAMRCVHEASLYEDNCFVTLTYDNENLPYDMSLNLRHFQLFMKRLRKAYTGRRIRFFHCGEYGDQNGRPHYHAILFNLDFWDKRLWKITKQGHPVFVSDQLSELWQQGFCLLGAVTFQSAAYVSRYIMKKVTGASATENYQWIHPETGEVLERKAEYATMSRRNGIGTEWYKRWTRDVYPNDVVVMEGVRMRPPKAYDRLLASTDPLEMEEISYSREKRAEKFADDNTEDRLLVKEKVKLSQISQLKRSV